jgi:peptide deformylase|tara:strand:+ start:2254 stop:2823 length:570 start_codon:yes stop_codon:yes gene_type:complete
MSIKEIIKVPNPFLKIIAKKVLVIDENILVLLDDMLDTMYNANGIGLAATQISEDKRLIVMDCGLTNLEHDDMSEEEYNKNVESNKIEPCPLKMINPEIIYYSSNITEREEGCLSIPGYNAEVKRPESITVNYTDISKNNITLEANGLLSTCIQHEIDHLNGVLFIDHISRLKKEVILRKAIKEFTNDK